MSKASFFYYFSSKEELMGELLATMLEAEAEALIAAIDAAADGLSALGSFYRAIVHRYRDDLETWRVLYLWSNVIGAPQEVLITRVYPNSARVNLRLEQKLRTDPRLHPEVEPRRLANITWSSAHGLLSVVSSLKLAGGATLFPVEQLVDEAVGVLTRGATNPASGPGSALPDRLIP